MSPPPQINLSQLVCLSRYHLCHLHGCHHSPLVASLKCCLKLTSFYQILSGFLIIYMYLFWTLIYKYLFWKTKYHFGNNDVRNAYYRAGKNISFLGMESNFQKFLPYFTYNKGKFPSNCRNYPTNNQISHEEASQYPIFSTHVHIPSNAGFCALIQAHDILVWREKVTQNTTRETTEISNTK